MRTEPKFFKPHGDDTRSTRQWVWLGPCIMPGGKDCDLWVLENNWILPCWGDRAYASVGRHAVDMQQADFLPDSMRPPERLLSEFVLSSTGDTVTRADAVAAIRLALKRARARGITLTGRYL